MKRWPTKPLGEVCAINPKLAPSETPASDAQVTFVPMAAVDEVSGSIARPELRQYHQVAKGYTPFRENDVLFAKITPCMQNGKAAIARGLRGGLGFGSTEFHVLRPSSGLLPQWVFAFVRQPSFRTVAEANFTGSAGQQRVPADFLKKFPIPVPPLSEQERIVKLLDEAEELRKLRVQADRRTAALLPALFHEMFGDPTHLEKMSWPFKALGEFTAVSYGLADKLDASTKPEDGTRILTISNVLLNGSIDTKVEKYSVVEPAERAKARLQNSDLLFNWRNGSEEHVGKTAIWEEQVEGEILHVSFLLKIRTDQSQANPYFLWALINRLRATGYFTRNARMQINRKFNASELSALKLPIPPLPLQKEFAQRVAEIRELEAGQAASRQRLKALFQSLLHRAFNGEL